MGIKNKERIKLRGKVISKNRTEINKVLKDGNIMNYLKEEIGIMNESEFFLDKEFLNSIKNDMEKNNLSKLVYTKEYKNHWLDEWIVMNEKKKKMKFRIKKKSM